MILQTCLARLRQGLRLFSGADAYQTYLVHWRRHHSGQEGAQPLSRKEFFRDRTVRRWQDINRCC